MKVKTEVLTYRNGQGVAEKYISYKCDKCNLIGNMWNKDNSGEIPEDQKQCNCEVSE
jgi:hypothetical protein